MLGFLEYEGEIFLGQENVKKLGNSTVRNYVGAVFQEPFIFSDTVKNNVDVLEKYSNEEIEKVCKICEIDKDIKEFPNKYNEILGERGINLSGGQKQRISIARILLLNKKIIIFDDSLSKIDNITKEKIKENLEKYDNEIINIYITQDFSKIPDEAKVFFIDKKRIVIDKQKNLINNNENYSKLINICKNMMEE